MKYMTFNSSCSYAGLANLLSFYGVDAEDREIALQMDLPYLFDYEDGIYLSGPMLQGAKWFDLYLNRIGFRLLEHQLTREEVCADLRSGPPAMLGLRVSLENKHAVICTGHQGGMYQFLNNKRQDSLEPDMLRLTEGDLLTRLDESVVVGRLENTAAASVSFLPCLEKSVSVFRNLREETGIFCSAEQSAAAIQDAMSRLFRPVLLDGVTMLELLGEDEISAALKAIRTGFLHIVKESRPAVLADELDIRGLDCAFAKYEELILEQMEMEWGSI